MKSCTLDEAALGKKKLKQEVVVQVNFFQHVLLLLFQGAESFAIAITSITPRLGYYPSRLLILKNLHKIRRL